MKPWRLNQKGQLVMPALFVLPSLVLFIWLIYSTADLSRDKIRHQFALDTAAFVEMTNYSDFLNRTAYVNGPFPSRVCFEAFSDPAFQLEDDPDPPNHPPLNLYKYFVDTGLCPYSTKCADPGSCAELANQSSKDWGYTYNEKPCTNGENCTTGRASKTPNPAPGIVLTSLVTAYRYSVYQQHVQNMLSNYQIIFHLLGVVEDSQIQVFMRLTKGGGHYFFNRAYSMNVPGERATSMGQLPSITPTPMRTQTVDAYFKTPADDQIAPTHMGAQPMPLLVVTTVGGLDASQSIPRRTLEQRWKSQSKNRFDVDVNSVLGQQPYVRATVEVSGGNIWPGATPRYQVRIYP